MSRDRALAAGGRQGLSRFDLVDVAAGIVGVVLGVRDPKATLAGKSKPGSPNANKEPILLYEFS